MGVWVAGQGVWLERAYRLEFLGERVFQGLWAASVLFLLVNCAVLAGVLVYRVRKNGVFVLRDGNDRVIKEKTRVGARRSQRFQKDKKSI